jgi:hypothetical protein
MTLCTFKTEPKMKFLRSNREDRPDVTKSDLKTHFSDRNTSACASLTMQVVSNLKMFEVQNPDYGVMAACENELKRE